MKYMWLLLTLPIVHMPSLQNLFTPYIFFSLCNIVFIKYFSVFVPTILLVFIVLSSSLIRKTSPSVSVLFDFFHQCFIVFYKSLFNVNKQAVAQLHIPHSVISSLNVYCPNVLLGMMCLLISRCCLYILLKSQLDFFWSPYFQWHFPRRN